MGSDKRERHRLKRAAKKARLVRRAVQVDESRARHERAIDAAYQAEARLRAGDAEGALGLAARAAAAWPSDVSIASLYVAAAEGSHDLEQRMRSYEHLLRLTPHDATLCIALAHCHLTRGALDAAGDATRRARAIFPRRMLERKKWLSALEAAERAVGTTAPAPPPPRRAEPDPVQASLFAPPAPATPRTRRPPASRPIARAPATAPPAAVTPPPTAPSPAAPPQAPPARLAPTTFEIPIALDPVIAGLDALGRSEWSAPEAVRLSVLATRVRDAESYDTLLALERAHGLRRLSHQEETARKVMAVLLGRALLADEVGLGKTIEAGLVLSEYLLRGRVARALVLAPPSLVRQWREELATKFAIASRTTEDAEARRDPTAFWNGPGVVIASLPTARAPQQRDLVAGAAWDLVIVDEAHALKNPRTHAHALVAHLTTRFLLLLTATPVENNVEELYTLVSLLRPGHLGGRAAFVRRLGGRSGRPSEAARREVRALLGEIMVRNTRALSGVHLPPRFARTILVEPTPDEGAMYRHLLEALRALGPRGQTRLLLSTLLQEAGSSPAALATTLARLDADAALPAAARAALAPAIGYAARLPDTGKAHALLRVVRGGDGAVIVFTRYRATLAFLGEFLTRHGVASERLDGSTPVAQRHAAIERVAQQNAILLCTDVGSEGLNLQFCHRLVNFDLPWNPMRIEQRIGRLHRIGQEHPVDVVNLCLAGSIEERMLRILDERINLFELVVGEVEMILGYLEEDGDFAGLMLGAFAVGEEADRERELGRIADALAAARTRYGRVTAYDEALFRNELGV